MSKALQAAAQQSDRAEGLEAKLNTATEKITKLEEEVSQRAAADINDAGPGEAEDTVKYQSQIAALKAEISSLNHK